MELVDGYIVVGDEAYTPAEWEERERKLARRRERYASDPAARRKKLDAMLEWQRNNREHKNEYNKNWMRRKRAKDASVS